MDDFNTEHLNRSQRKLANTINKWLHARLGCWPSGGGCRAYYTPKEWRERGELYGRESALILCHDGGDLAPFLNLDYGNYKGFDDFYQMMRELGYYTEACTSWYTAVYPL